VGHHIFSTTELKKLKVECAVPNKYPHPPQGRLTEIPRGEGFQKPKFLKESMKLKRNFQFPGRGGGGQKFYFSRGGEGVFFGKTQ